MENSIFLASDYEEEQVDAIKEILRVYFSGDIEFSKNFSGLKPNIDNGNLKKVLNELDSKVTRNDLIGCVNDINVMAYNGGSKLYFMYDVNRKFMIGRKTVLGNYPSEKDYGFCLDKWINKCDNTLHDSSSDLQNAIYSNMLDICYEEVGILVIRICEDDSDWADDHAMEKLNEITSNIGRGDFC